MKTLTLLLVLFTTLSAQANITCKGAISYAVEDVLIIQKALITDSINFQEAFDGLDLENGRHRDVILACKVKDPQEKYPYCSVVPKLLIQRDALIKKSALLTKREKNKLYQMNKHNRELAFITCP